MRAQHSGPRNSVFDLGVGHWRYKEDLGGVGEPLCSGTMFAPGVRASGLRLGETALVRARQGAPEPVRALYRRARSRLAASRSPRDA